MKALKIITVFLLVHFSLFFVLSTIGLLWCDSYTEIIRNPNWFMIYTLFIGTWVALIVCLEIWNDLFETI